MLSDEQIDEMDPGPHASRYAEPIGDINVLCVQAKAYNAFCRIINDDGSLETHDDHEEILRDAMAALNAMPEYKALIEKHNALVRSIEVKAEELEYESEGGIGPTDIAVSGCAHCWRRMVMFDCAPKLSDEQIVEIFKESPVVGTDLTTIRTTDLFALCANAKDRNAMEESLSTMMLNAEIAPDPRMSGATDCYLVPMDDIEELRALLEERG